MEAGQKMEPLQHITPTGLPAFHKCALRGLWQLNREQEVLPPGPAARLGTVIHKLLEEAGRGAFSEPVNGDPEARWIELLADTERRMGQRPLEKNLVPLNRHVRRFEVLRLQALERARELAASFSPPQPGADGKTDPVKFGPELKVQSEDGLVVGSIDRALPGDSGAILQDYKSGALFSIDDEGNQENKPEYSLQLRLYAALYRETAGEWPARLELVPLRGDSAEVPFNPDECSQALASAKEVLHSVNAVIERSNGDIDELQRLLARPSPDACFFCTYRPVCAPYLAGYPPADESSWPTDICGELERIKSLGNGSLMLKIRPRSGPTLSVRGLDASLHQAGKIASCGLGDQIGVFNARRTGSSRAFEPGPRTVILPLELPDGEAS